MKLNTRDLSILAFYELRMLARSGPGVLSLLFLLMWTLLWISSAVNNAETLNSLGSGSLSQEQTMLLAAVQWLADLDDAFVQRLLQSHSPFITSLYVMVAFATPLFTIVASLDQNASDISGKGIRFLLPRTTRQNLVVGRFLGTFLFWGVLLVVLGAATTCVALGLDEHHGPALIVMDGLWFTLGLLLASLPVVALMAFCGVVAGSPLLSATMGLGIYAGVALLGGLGGWIDDVLKVFRYPLPMWLRYDLMLGSAREVIVATAATLGYTAVFLGAAIWTAQKRDL